MTPAREMIVDSFAGGGGASTGIEMALGVSPDYAVNHDAVALGMHAVNHPRTRHLASNIWKVDCDAIEPGRPIGLLWASPDCTDHSKAKGGMPLRKHIRDLAWVVVLWAQRRRPPRRSTRRPPSSCRPSRTTTGPSLSAPTTTRASSSSSTMASDRA